MSALASRVLGVRSGAYVLKALRFLSPVRVLCAALRAVWSSCMSSTDPGAVLGLLDGPRGADLRSMLLIVSVSSMV